MSEGICFLLIMALVSLVLCWMLGRWPRVIKLLAAAAPLCIVLPMQVRLFSYTSPQDGDLFVPHAQAPSSPLSLILWLLCSLAVLLMLSQGFIRPLRQRMLPRRSRLLFVSAFTLLPLQMALFMECFSPVFGSAMNLIVVALVLLLLLWNGAILGLHGYLSRNERSARTRT